MARAHSEGHRAAAVNRRAMFSFDPFATDLFALREERL
jgi:hypothetical protein